MSIPNTFSSIPNTIPTLWMPCPKVLWPHAELHLWRADLGTVLVDASSLSPDEQARSEHFRRTRSLLRCLLGQYLNQVPVNLRFSYGANGKPSLAAGQSPEVLYFNLTHTDNLALVAVTAVAEAGVDAERVRPVAHAGKIARRFFSAAEIAWLDAEPSADHFFQLWTRKEAWLKAQGAGLFLPSKHEALVSLGTIDAGKGYASAIAVCGIMPPVKFWEW